MSNDLTPAQSTLLDTLRAAAAPVVVEGPRRYTLVGERLHYGTVEALERRGYLRRDPELGVLLLVVQGEVFTDTAPATEEARAPATPPADSDTSTPAPVVDDLDPAPADTDTITPHDLDHTARAAVRYAELRRAEDVNQTDPGATARAALLARRRDPELGRLLLDDPHARIVETPPQARAYPPAPRKEQRQDQSVFSGLWRLLRGALS